MSQPHDRPTRATSRSPPAPIPETHPLSGTGYHREAMTVRLARPSLSLVLLTLGLAAQTQTIVSPVGNTGTEGSAGNTIPFMLNTPRRYQQICSDIGGSVKIIKKLAFRMNALNGAQSFTERRIAIGFGGALERHRRAIQRDLRGVPGRSCQGDEQQRGPRCGTEVRDVIQSGPCRSGGHERYPRELAPQGRV